MLFTDVMRIFPLLIAATAVLFSACRPTCDQPPVSRLDVYLREQGPLLKPVAGGFELEPSMNAEACGVLETGGLTVKLNGQAITAQGGSLEWELADAPRNPVSLDPVKTRDDGICVCNRPRLLGTFHDPKFPETDFAVELEMTDGKTTVRATYAPLVTALTLVPGAVNGNDITFVLKDASGEVLNRGRVGSIVSRIEQDGETESLRYSIEADGSVTVTTSPSAGSRINVQVKEHVVTQAATECVGITCGLRSATAPRQDLPWSFR